MKRYIHNPALFRDHFIGKGLPAFRGARMQRGHGAITSKLKRFAVPLLKAGAKAATPYIAKAVNKVASTAVQRVLPGSPAMQQFVGNAAGKVTNRAIKSVAGKNGLLGLAQHTNKKRKRSNGVTRTTKIRRTTRNIFT